MDSLAGAKADCTAMGYGKKDTTGRKRYEY
jgi:hypothetical protein